MSEKRRDLLDKLKAIQTKRAEFEAGEVVRVDGRVDTYKGAPQIIVRTIARCRPEEVNLLDFLPKSGQDPEAMAARLGERLRRTPEGPIRSLLLSVVEDPSIAPRFKLAPAATTFHHAYLGGLLEHVLSLVELGDLVCDHYPSLDRELILAGLVLHDIGKIEELEYAGGFRYSTRGQLVGHIVLSLEIVREKTRAIELGRKLFEKEARRYDLNQKTIVETCCAPTCACPLDAPAAPRSRALPRHSPRS